MQQEDIRLSKQTFCQSLDVNSLRPALLFDQIKSAWNPSKPIILMNSIKACGCPRCLYWFDRLDGNYRRSSMCLYMYQMDFKLPHGENKFVLFNCMLTVGIIQLCQKATSSSSPFTLSKIASGRVMCSVVCFQVNIKIHTTKISWINLPFRSVSAEKKGKTNGETFRVPHFFFDRSGK